MEHELVYRKLQQHLDKQAVGFPATKSGAELTILAHIFSPEEAWIATHISYRFESAESIYAKAPGLADSAESLTCKLDGLMAKGGVERKIENGIKRYCTAPLVVGMYEYQLERLTPEFIEAFNEYTRDRKYGMAFLGTELPQMRTIPVNKAVKVPNTVSTYDEVDALLDAATEPFTIVECICRKKKALQYKEHTCEATDRKETCLAIGHMAASVLSTGRGRQLTRDEAKDIIRKNQEEGLVLQPSNAAKPEFICSCCGCCCGMLGIQKRLPRPVDFWASNFHAVVDETGCNGCGVCAKKCQVGALSLDAKKAKVNLNRCIGCGVCTLSCKPEAVTLEKNSKEVTPPQSREELFDIIMEKKKGRLGQIKTMGKIMRGAVKKGRR